MDSKRNETFGSDIFGTSVIQGTWSGRQAIEEAATRVPGAPPTGGRAPTLVGPLLLHRRTSFAYIYTPVP